jgi:hypothetical protein
MSPLTSPLTTATHTGPCLALPARLHGCWSPAGTTREYCLHDLAGSPLGTIAAPMARPVVGPSAPTVFLRRGVSALRG